MQKPKFFVKYEKINDKMAFTFLFSENIDCYNVEDDPKGLEYRGFQNVSAAGFVCQKWTSQTPNNHDMTEER